MLTTVDLGWIVCVVWPHHLNALRDANNAIEARLHKCTLAMERHRGGGIWGKKMKVEVWGGVWVDWKKL